MNKQVIIYTSSICSVCSMLRSFLEDMGIEYKEICVDFHPVERMKLVAKSKRITVPQLRINDVWISGFDPIKILAQMKK